MAIADLVSTLAKHEVEFIIVGGMAAILRGTPVNTFDLDVVYERSAPNIERLLNALDELEAIVRDDPRRRRLNRSHLESPSLPPTPSKTQQTLGFQLWRTRAEEFRTALVSAA
jgi:hypothetical protein